MKMVQIGEHLKHTTFLLDIIIIFQNILVNYGGPWRLFFKTLCVKNPPLKSIHRGNSVS